MSERSEEINISSTASKAFSESLQEDGRDVKSSNISSAELVTYEVIHVDDHMTNINIAQFLDSEIEDDHPSVNDSEIPYPEYPESEEDSYEEEEDIWDDFSLAKLCKQKLGSNHGEKIPKKDKQKRVKSMVRYKQPPMVEFDEETKFLLHRLVQTRFMGRYHGIIGTGTKSIVLFGHCCTCVSMRMPWEATVKVYENDKNNKEAVYKRTQNEFRSLDRIYRCHMNVPMPVCAWRNIIMMGSIGYGSNTSINHAPPEFTHRNYWHILDSMKRMYQVAKVVHGNLSHRSILWHGQPYFIGLGHSVPADHPNALKLLIRDCFNVNNIFKDKGLSEMKTNEELFQFVTDLPDIDETLLEVLSKLKRIDPKDDPVNYNSVDSTIKSPLNYKSILEFCTVIHSSPSNVGISIGPELCLMSTVLLKRSF